LVTEKRVTTTRRAPLPPTRLILPAFVFGLGLVGLFLLPGYLLYAGSAALWYGLVGLGLFLPMAVLRELPLHGAALTGLSAYLFAFVAADGGVESWVLGAVVAIGATVVASLLTGLASLVVTGLYFAVGSLVVQVFIEKVIFSVGELTGGAGGRGVDQPDLSGWFNTNRAVFFIAGVICLVVSVVVWYVKRTRFVPDWVMAGHEPEGADSVGIRRWTQKLVVFGLSGLLIGIAGCLAAFVNGTPPPVPQFGVIWSVILIAIPLASGMRTVSAVWFVAACFTAIPILLESHRINPNFLSGAILLFALLIAQLQVVVMDRLRRERQAHEPVATAGAPLPVTLARPGARGRPPEGLGGRGRAPSGSGVRGRPPEWTSATDATRPSQVLAGTGIRVMLGGVRAVDGVDVRVAPGQRVAIVGANGAGKTTLLNALCGFVPLTGGRVTLGDVDITNVPAFKRARLGIGRTFQLPRVADVLTVRQSVMCGYPPVQHLGERIEWLMERFGVADKADAPIGTLSFGRRRRAEIVRALVRLPEVLLVDEAVAGLEDEEVLELIELLLELQAAEGWGLVVVEHDLSFVTGIAEDLMVMEDGILIAEGPLDAVLADDRVRRIYLGETESPDAVPA
jgi:ABC-type branched-subunit amino acid transport system ATPase component/ABC-type branched-subunit amino acid transport system permease subunit